LIVVGRIVEKTGVERAAPGTGRNEMEHAGGRFVVSDASAALKASAVQKPAPGVADRSTPG